MGIVGFRSKFGGQARAEGLHSVAMGGSSSSSGTVPSIVVYVTVPNKEVGSYFFFFEVSKLGFLCFAFSFENLCD